MAMTREEEKELRISCSMGTLLSALGNRSDLKEDRPVQEETDEDENNEGRLKRNAEDEDGGKKKKVGDEAEEKAIEYFLKDTPDYEKEDPDWVIEEKKYLIQEYGKKIITLGFDEKDRFTYTCEICNVECNQRKMLEAHCLGMKHLRKKSLHDRKLQGKDVPDTFKVCMTGSKKSSKPSGKAKPNEGEEGYPSKKKNKWSTNYYGYGPGGHPPYPPPPYGPPPGFPGGLPNFPSTIPSPGFYGHWGSNSPNIFSSPPPTVDNKGINKNSLAGGDTGPLLQRLADCAVKNEKDSELAINVVIALMKSLKDFNHKRGETRFIEVLTEADVTFRMLKTLKPLNKNLDNSHSPDLDELQDQHARHGMSEFSQGAHSSSQNVNLPDGQGAPSTVRSISLPNNQYDKSSQCNPANDNYSGSSGPEFPGQPSMSVPPPSSGKGANGYPEAGPNSGYDYPPGQSYSSQVYGYDIQGPNAQTYGSHISDSQGYSNQGSNSRTGFYNQATDNSNSNGRQKSSTESSQSINTATPVSPPPPPPPADGNTPDFSNYGYAAGYSMGYFDVPPPAYNQPY